MKSRPGTYYVTVLEDVNTGKIVGAATLVVELKFIHCCNQVGKWPFLFLFVVVNFNKMKNTISERSYRRRHSHA